MKLRKLLNIRTPMAIGYLCMLWLWSLDNAQNGDLSTLTPREIASICDYRGKDPKNLINALIESGFLNADLSIHDWFDYTGKLILSRNLKRKRDREYYSKKKSEIESPSADSLPTEPNSTQENRTEQYSTEQSRKEENTALDRVCELFSLMIHKTNENERIRLSSLLEDYSFSSIEDTIKKSAGIAKTINYVEKVLKSSYPEKRKSSFDIDELDRVIRSL